MHETETSLQELNAQRSIERGQRLTELLRVSGLTSPEAFCDALQIKPETFKAWRFKKERPLTTRGAKNIVDAAENIGIAVSTNWLLYGTGAAPIKLDSLSSDLSLADLMSNYDALIDVEKKRFHKQHTNTVTIKLTDDSMSPLYNKGSTLFGLWQTGKSVIELDNKACLVELSNGEVVCRKLLIVDPEKNLCALLTLNEAIISNTGGLQPVPLRAAVIFSHYPRLYTH